MRKIDSKKVNEQRQRLLSEVAAVREVWPLLINVPDFMKNKWVRDRMGSARLASALNLPERIRDADTPSIFVTPIYLQLEEVRGEQRSSTELKELQRVEMNSPADELDDIVEGLIRAKENQVISEASPSRLSVYRWRSALESGWARKAALLPKLSKSTIPQWVEAGYWLCAFLCDGDFQSSSWPASLYSRKRDAGGTLKGGIKKLLRDGFRAQATRASRKGS